MNEEPDTEELEQNYASVVEQRDLLIEHNEVLHVKLTSLEEKLEQLESEIKNNRKTVKDTSYGLILLGLVFAPILFTMMLSNIAQVKITSNGEYEIQTSAFPFEKLGMLASAVLGTGGLIVGNKKGLRHLIRRERDD